jgi:diguanylate cyclase (GGDEF)-like protein
VTRLNIKNRRPHVICVTKSVDGDSDPNASLEPGRVTSMTFFTSSMSGIRHFVPCILAASFGVAVSLGAADVTANHERQNAGTQFRVVAENHFMVVQNGLNEYVNRLRAVRALFDSSDAPVSRNAFESFVRPLLLEDAAITNLSWVPRVPDAERAAHEREGAAAGLPGYHIKDIAADGTMAAAAERDEYYPIFYATPPLTSPLFGLDLRSEPRTWAEMEFARDGDRLGYSPVRTLVTTGGTKSGFLFFLPIYRRGSPHATLDDRRQNLIGFVHGSLITSTMIDTIIAENKTPKGLDSYFYESGGRPEGAPFYIHGSRLRTTPAEARTAGNLQGSEHWSRELTADGQPWLTMDMVPMPDGPLIVHHDRSWIVLIFGLIITAAIVIYISSSRRHAWRMMQVNRQVSDLAQTDALTALVNRRAFMTRLGAAFAACRRGAKPFAVLYFDLDHFKDVNDMLGHAVGDALLRQVAARTNACVRGNDVVARIGGDEFAILQTDAEDAGAAGAFGDKLAVLLNEPYMIGGNEVHISVSIGISYYEPETVGPDAMMIQADLALYRAKEDGRNCVRFHSAELDRQVRERVVLADDLRGAIERGELELHYQPQVELRTRRIVGLEALLRWRHHKRGNISPSVFIPIAERSGQINVLGQWVLDAACRQLRLWQDQGIAPEILGVNFSALQFKGSATIDRDVAASLGKWGIAPDRIELELTETVLMEITQQHSDRFEDLRRLGVRIAIDDFGTGYSSLSYLANYPINRVKIAQELMFGVDTDHRSATVVRAAIRLAHELGIEIIAEGIETEGQEKFLLSAGCERGQGFYYSKGVDAAHATELLRAGKIEPARLPLRLVQPTAA